MKKTDEMTLAFYLYFVIARNKERARTSLDSGSKARALLMASSNKRLFTNLRPPIFREKARGAFIIDWVTSLSVITLVLGA